MWGSTLNTTVYLIAVQSTGTQRLYTMCPLLLLLLLLLVVVVVLQ